MGQGGRVSRGVPGAGRLRLPNPPQFQFLGLRWVEDREQTGQQGWLGWAWGVGQGQIWGNLREAEEGRARPMVNGTEGSVGVRASPQIALGARGLCSAQPWGGPTKA